MTADSDLRRRSVSAIVRPLSRDAEEDMLRAIRPIVYASNVPENFMDYGLPRAAEERRQERRVRLWRHCWRVGIVFVLLGAGFMLGYNVHLALAEPDMSAFNVRALTWIELHPGKAGCWTMRLENTPFTYRVCRRADPVGKITLRSEGM